MTHPMLRIPPLVTASVLLAASSGLGQERIRSERVQFERDATSAVVESSITGYEIVDYVLGAGEGQYMNVSMATDNTASYFNILAPGEDEVAMFNGSMAENQYEGILPESGDYKIRVYMMRSAARRNEVANFRLEMIITAGDDAAESEEAVPGAEDDFDATGQIPCAQAAGQPMGQCKFGVMREGDGTATVVITRPDGRIRALSFIDGRFNSEDTSQADGYPAYSATREGDLTTVRVGDERYEIPDAVIYGG